jgi:hypothetical protein
VEKAEKMAGNGFQRGASRSASFLNRAVSPPRALGVTGDLDKEESRNDLGTGDFGTAGSSIDHMRRGVSLALSFLSPTRPNSCGSWIRLARRPSRTVERLSA